MIDLHVHTKASDGTFSPEEVVRHAASKGLKAIAVTDHDTLNGVRRAQFEGARQGIEVISGIEISAHWENGILHILGYYVDLDNVRLKKSLDFLQNGRHERVPKLLWKLAAHNVHISPAEVEFEVSGGVPGRPHVANVMVKKGYVKNVQEAFDLYLKKGAPAYVDKTKLSPREAMRVVAGAAKLCVLAHPYSLDTESAEQFERIIRTFMSYGLSGIEIYYPKHTATQTEFFLNLASKLNLAVTGGTDFHGSNKPEVEIGTLPEIGALPYSILSDLKKRIEENSTADSNREQAPKDSDSEPERLNGRL
jgi:3',5'-nucleoside bisphosphate phosphatase